MKQNLGPLLLLVILLVPDLTGQVVRPRAARAAILDNAERAVEVNSEVRARPLEIPDNPFVVWVDPATLRPPPTRAEPAPVVAARLSDSEALEAIAAELRPTGSLIMRDRAILNLPGNRTLERGQQFDVRIGAEDYTVMVEAVSADSFTLRLGEARLTRNFAEERMRGGRITRPGEP